MSDSFLLMLLLAPALWCLLRFFMPEELWLRGTIFGLFTSMFLSFQLYKTAAPAEDQLTRVLFVGIDTLLAVSVAGSVVVFLLDVFGLSRPEKEKDCNSAS